MDFPLQDLIQYADFEALKNLYFSGNSEIRRQLNLNDNLSSLVTELKITFSKDRRNEKKTLEKLYQDDEKNSKKLKKSTNI